MKHIVKNSFTEEMCQDFLTVLFTFKHDLIAIADKQGLTVMQLYALMDIKQTGNMSMGKMAQLLHCDASNVTGIIDRLVSKGLLIKEENVNDRREKILRTTPSGSMLVTQSLASLPERLGGSLSDEEIANLHEILKKINAT
jgi:DNA-binding MarR family transcriptional regulator